MTKFDLVRDLLLKDGLRTPRGTPKLLDVGCRDCELREYVADVANYEGLDQFQNTKGTVSHVADVSRGLPFDDLSYDYVVALDVVEHIDDMHRALHELTRITRSTLLVMLPNMAHIFFRFRFLTTGRFSEKYDLTFGQGSDRHRWTTVLPQCDRFMRDFAHSEDLVLEQTRWLDVSPRKAAISRALRLLAFPPSLWTWGTLYTLRRTSAGK